MFRATGSGGEAGFPKSKNVFPMCNALFVLLLSAKKKACVQCPRKAKPEGATAKGMGGSRCCRAPNYPLPEVSG